MIAKLKGIVDERRDDHAIIDVGGVGYLVLCATRTLGNLPAEGGRVTLWIETVQTQEQTRLYGFLSEEERNWFRLLQTVQSVGGKVALAILSTLSIEELNQAIATGDKTSVARANGVGPKLAQRIVIELKDKAIAVPGAAIIPLNRGGRPGGPMSGPVAEAVSALINLGYSQGEAQAAVAAAQASAGEGEGVSVGILIKAGLAALAGRVA